MAYDEYLSDRVKNIFNEKRVSFDTKKMMGGLCFMIDHKMCCAIMKDMLMARIDPDFYQKALIRTGASEMNFTGKAIKGFVFVSSEGLDLGNDLDYWIQLCIDFNPRAKASKKRTKKTINIT